MVTNSQVFSEALNSLLPLMEQQLEELMAIEGHTNTLLEVLERYSELMQRCWMVADEIQFTALAEFFTILSSNLYEIAGYDYEQRLTFHPVLMQWPALVQNYLYDINQTSYSDALIDYLQQPCWPTPLAQAEAENLKTQFLNNGKSVEDSQSEEEVLPSALTEEEMDISIPFSTRPAVVEAFLQEAPEYCAEIMPHLEQLSITTNNKEATQHLNAIKRLVHSLKGASATVGIAGIRYLTHDLEDILTILEQEHQNPPKLLFQHIQIALLCVSEMIEAARHYDQAPEYAKIVFTNIHTVAHFIRHDQFSNALAFLAESPLPVLDPIASNALLQDEQEALLRLSGELAIFSSQLQEQTKTLSQSLANSLNHAQYLYNQGLDLEERVDIKQQFRKNYQYNKYEGEDFDKLELEEYSEFQSFSRAFLESIEDNYQILKRNQQIQQNIEQLLGQQNRLYKQWEKTLIRSRLASVNTLSNRLHRIVSQSAQATNKLVQLVIEDHALQIDNTILQGLVDPLLHLLRNAVDHGIETPAERREKGKPEQGQITLSFNRKGPQLLITCQDDGQGLDYERIAQIAYEKQMLDPYVDADENILNRLILLPNFSSRTEISEQSGRGIGMDVVAHAVYQLRGTIDIKSIRHKGASFYLEFPANPLSIHCLIVEINKQRYGLLSKDFHQSIIYQTITDNTIQIANQSYPIQSLAEYLGQTVETLPQTSYALIAKSTALGHLAIQVDKVIAAKELIIKPLGDYAPNIPGLIGGTVLENGDVLPLLDIAALIKSPLLYTPDQEENIIAQKQARATVLIADDSLSVRKALSALLEKNQYHVLQARHGLEALSILEQHPADILLLDLEMPYMNGLDLTSHLRLHETTQQLPIIMITSRSTEKHRLNAEKAGVNVYLTKPYSEQVLLETIDTLLQK